MPDVQAAFEKAFDEVSSAAQAKPVPPSNAPSTASPEPPPPVAEPEAEAEAESETPVESPTDEPDEDGEPNPLSVSAEDYARIKSDPGLSKTLKSMNKAFTQKTMALAAERQAQQSELKLLDGLKNPASRDATFAAIAAAIGKNIAESIPAKDATTAKVEAAVDKRLDSLVETFKANGFDPKVAEALAKSMAPAMTSMAKEELKAIIDSEVAPIKEATGQLAYQATLAQSGAEIKAFWANHPGEYSKELEAKMTALSTKFQMADDVDTPEYLEFLLRAAKPDKTTAAAVKEVSQRMAKAAATQEPKAGIQPGRVASTPAGRESNFGRRDIEKILDDRFIAAWNEGDRR